MKILLNAVGGMIFLAGLVFFLQGINILPGSSMTGDPQWAINGAIMMAGSQGHFELNVFKPVMIHNLLHSIRLIHDACHGFVEFCINGIELNRDQIDHYLKNSLMLVTALNPHIGYDKAAKIAKHAHQKKISLREAAVELGFLSGEDFDKFVKPEAMTHP